MATKVLGREKLKKQLANIPAAVRAATKQALAEGADEMVGMMKRLAPVGPVSGKGRKIGLRPGALRDSIVQSWGSSRVAYSSLQTGSSGIGDPDLTVKLSAGNTRVRYAHLAEFGTAPHEQGGKFKGARHPGTAAQAFFYPSYRALRKRVKGRVTRAMVKSIKRIAADSA